MSDHVYLHGAEDVRTAGHRIAEAAGAIRSAASEFDGLLQRLERVLVQHATDVAAAAELNGLAALVAPSNGGVADGLVADALRDRLKQRGALPA